MGDSPRKTAAIRQLLDEADRPSAPCSVVDRVTAMAWDKLAIHEAIEATHPWRMETPESYAADALAMELIHKRHDKREIVNLIRWCLMGCPPNAGAVTRGASAPPSPAKEEP